jgi:hypothetical protein
MIKKSLGADGSVQPQKIFAVELRDLAGYRPTLSAPFVILQERVNPLKHQVL